MNISIEEKRKALGEYCAANHPCGSHCLFADGVSWCDTFNENNAPDELIEAAYDRIYPPIPEEVPEPIVHDIINHPTHYCREGAMECIEEMEILFGKEAVKHFCLCNAWKYRYRSSAKNGDEDINKSDWYILKYKELCSNG